MRMLLFRQTRFRPEFILLLSLLILVFTLVYRSRQDQAQASLAVDTSGPAPAPVELGSMRMINSLQERIRKNPEDTDAYAQLGQAFLQRMRETTDPSLYAQAETAFSEALKRDPQHLDALLGQAALALSRHQFGEALRLGEQALTLNPYRAQIYGVIGDAQVELGRYDAAVATIQKMVDTRPDLSSYSRVSYLRELHGDTAGAIAAMEQAVKAGFPSSEQALWTKVQLGHLHFNSGALMEAEATYMHALQTRPDYIHAFAGMARVRAAQGKHGEAISYYQKLVELYPLPEFVIALGELYEVTDQPAKAKEQYDLVRAMQQLNAAAGVDVDLELALFNADHGVDPAQTVAQARAAYARRSSIYAADVLAWALFQQGKYDEAWQYAQEALRLGTRDAALHFHAGMIAYKLGDVVKARQQLEQALAINPAFSIRYAPQTRELLRTLGAGS